MNGAVQGDAMTTASTPEPNASTMRFFADHSATPDGHELPELEHAREVQRQHEEQRSRAP